MVINMKKTRKEIPEEQDSDYEAKYLEYSDEVTKALIEGGECLDKELKKRGFAFKD